MYVGVNVWCLNCLICLPRMEMEDNVWRLIDVRFWRRNEVEAHRAKVPNHHSDWLPAEGVNQNHLSHFKFALKRGNECCRKSERAQKNLLTETPTESKTLENQNSKWIWFLLFLFDWQSFWIHMGSPAGFHKTTLISLHPIQKTVTTLTRAMQHNLQTN